MGAREKEALIQMSFFKSVFVIRAALLLAVICLPVLAGCTFSTSGDVTPAPGLQTVIPTGLQPAAQQTQAPIETAPATAVPDTQSTQPAAAADHTVTFTGRVINASGGQTPAGLDVALQIYENMELASTVTAAADADSVYRFALQSVAENRLFRLMVEYQGLLFSSGIVDPYSEGASGEYALDVTVYDTNTSADGLTIDRAHIFITAQTDDRVQLVVYLLISNPTAFVITAPEGKPVLFYNVPPNAANLQVDDGGMTGRILMSEGGFGDTLSIYPGMQQHEVLYSYELPYARSAVLSLDFPLPVNSGTLILPVGFNLRGEGLSDAGEREMSTSVVHLYNFGPLPAGQPLAFDLSGRSAPGGLSTGALAAFGAGALLIVLLGSWLWLRKRSAGRVETEPPAVHAPQDRPMSDRDADAVLDEIVSLDREFEEGRLSEAEYHQRREQLKEQLRRHRGQ